MITSNSARLSYSTKLKLKTFRKSSSCTKSLRLLEEKILDELNEFSKEIKNPDICSLKLTLRVNPARSEFEVVSSINLLRKILETRGQLRWLSDRFFTPVLHAAHEITRWKLMISIIINWRLFSKEVLSRLHIDDISANLHEQIPLEAYSNSNFEVTLNPNDLYILESDYNSRLRFSKANAEWLRKYTIGRIILWDSRCATSFIRSSEKLGLSPSFIFFLDKFQDLTPRKEFFSTTKVQVHANAGDTLDQRVSKSEIRRADSIENVQIWHQRFIMTKSDWLLIDETCSPQLDFVAGQWQYIRPIGNDFETVDLKKPNIDNPVEIPEAIFLMGRADENWYHLLLDTLPRYLFFTTINPEIPVLIRADLPKTSLNLLHQLIPRKIILVKPNETISVGLLHFVPARSTVFDSKSENGQELVQFSPLILSVLKEWILDILSKSETSVLPSKIYIERRAKYRNVINEKRVKAKLTTMGYEVIKCTDDFYLNQAHYFECANHVVAPGGAVLANILFMNEGCRVTVIRSSRNSNLELWQKLAIACGIELEEVIGIPSYYGVRTLARMHSNYFLPLRRLKSIS